MLQLCLFLLLLFLLATLCRGALFDKNGYVVYCPCMGRFGNQMEHFLGVLSFSHTLNRTLVLPPLVEYHYGSPTATMVDFDKYFIVKPLANYHRVVVMRDFIKELAPKIWPRSKRKVFCWAPRKSIYQKDKPDGCFAKEGNPFGPFWDYSKVDFVGEIYYGTEIQGGFHVSSPAVAEQWFKRYPASDYPVLAFSSAPADFPARPADHQLQRYIHWTKGIIDIANSYIKQYLKRPFIGIHLRNNVDWENVCDLVKDDTKELFGSAQCTGKLTKEMCLPSLSTILNNITNMAKTIRAKSVFISSDHRHYLQEIQNHLKPLKVEVYNRVPEDLHVNLAILSLADHFIGNCVSTLSSFVHRSRRYASEKYRSTTFFGHSVVMVKDEL